ncbi:ceramide 1-phosphate binding [Homalodisca vitripennis]|nr:ceramide 1-phosphate binding [Homalodisca vitripennis]
MGSVFGFVGSEISSKMEALEQVRTANKSNNFSTMKRMVQFEIDKGMLKDSSYISGSRTLLRLHRGLVFKPANSCYSTNCFFLNKKYILSMDRATPCYQPIHHMTLEQATISLAEAILIQLTTQTLQSINTAAQFLFEANYMR